MASCTITFAGSSPACPQSLSTAGLQGGPSRRVVQVLSRLRLLATLPYVTVYRNRVRLAGAASPLPGLSLSGKGRVLKHRIYLINTQETRVGLCGFWQQVHSLLQRPPQPPKKALGFKLLPYNESLGLGRLSALVKHK